MNKRIRQTLAACDLCQKTKISCAIEGKMHHVISERPNDILCLDLMGPLPVSRGGATQLLVTVDAFSKFVKFYPLRRATTKPVLNKLRNDYFPNYGPSQKILTDNGTQFRSQTWISVLESANIKYICTCVYHPQGNMTERVNREIGSILRAFCHMKHTKWATMTAQIEVWLNQAVHKSTGYAPIELHLNEKRSNPFLTANMFPSVNRVMNKSEPPILELAYNGSRVLIRTHPQSNAMLAEIKKFFLLYEGPYVVKKSSGANSYVLTDLDGKIKGTYHMSELKPFVTAGHNPL
ncbi:hypothetical protein ILUMI_21675 [Ignelater luminosus]|uniref:Integrase catalytic domain-containing protein n=1 Tax=Ignelater luminosus TaxID=2038154 RepID=A0A8K0CG00_IGNLU|nr:hypothetical protein ILUMI_21675 [Ignelater luminosus]